MVAAEVVTSTSEDEVVIVMLEGEAVTPTRKRLKHPTTASVIEKMMEKTSLSSLAAGSVAEITRRSIVQIGTSTKMVEVVPTKVSSTRREAVAEIRDLQQRSFRHQCSQDCRHPQTALDLR